MTSKVVHRLYWDFEKEERWLNEMAAKGEDLVRYRLGSYHFERGEPGEWVYRIELIPSRPGSEAGRDYLSFLRGTGVEVVSTHLRWAYLRRSAALGPFELFSDLESRIGHYRRVIALFTIIIAALVPAAVSNILSLRGSGGLIFLVPLAAVAAAWAVLAVQDVRLARRVRSLKAERQVYE
jgi:hypothetical protein